MNDATKPTKPPRYKPRKPCVPDLALAPRVAARPDPAQWGDEPITLYEAAALFFPTGKPLTITSLRTAAHRGVLPVSVVQGKFLTTPAAVRAMLAPTPRGVRPTPPPGDPNVAAASTAPPTALVAPPRPLRARMTRQQKLEEALRRSAIKH